MNTAAIEQLFLDHVLVASWCQRPVWRVLGLLAEPGQGAIEMMQPETLDAGNVIINHSVGAVAV